MKVCGCYVVCGCLWLFVSGLRLLVFHDSLWLLPHTHTGPQASGNSAPYLDLGNRRSKGAKGTGNGPGVHVASQSPNSASRTLSAAEGGGRGWTFPMSPRWHKIEISTAPSEVLGNGIYVCTYVYVFVCVCVCVYVLTCVCMHA